MAFQTLGGFAQSETNADGMKAYDNGQPLLSAHLLKTLLDLMQATRHQSLAGVLSGGACTADDLDVAGPAGTVYISGGVVWWTEDDYLKNITDDDTTYLWGCSDGLIHETETVEPPDGFTLLTACLITKAVATAGVVRLYNSVQQRAMTAYPETRFVATNNAGLYPVPKKIPTEVVAVVPADSQLPVYDYLDIEGSLDIEGEVIIV